MDSFYQFPKQGSIVSISHNGRFIGGTNVEKHTLELRSFPSLWEGFVVEHHGNKIAFKQFSSGLYLGKYIQENGTPQLAKNRGEWELFSLVGHHNYVLIKSHFNTYLTIQNNKLIWKQNPKDQKLWIIHPLSHKINQLKQVQNIQNKNQNLLPDFNEEFAIQKNNKFIGGINKMYSILRLVDKNDSWEKFFLLRHIDGTVTFMQKITSFYIAVSMANNSNSTIHNEIEAQQRFILEIKGNNTFAIKGYKNTYLTAQDYKLVWKENPQNESHHFKFVITK